MKYLLEKLSFLLKSHHEQSSNAKVLLEKSMIVLM